MLQASQPQEPCYLTANDVRRITRSKRERRSREATPITTGRDEAVFGVAQSAQRNLLGMIEVQERLARLAVVRSTDILGLATDSERLQYWCHLPQVAQDYDGALGDVPTLDYWALNWDRVHARIRAGWPPVVCTSWTGRKGRESSMTPDAIWLATRSLALRPLARKELNDERNAGHRGGGAERTQLGHFHAQGGRARGVGRADELAAQEAGRDYGLVSGEIVGKYRRDLRKVLKGL